MMPLRESTGYKLPPELAVTPSEKRLEFCGPFNKRCQVRMIEGKKCIRTPN